MWTDEQRTRFQTLRDREEEGRLTDDERAELTAMIAEVEAMEATTLRPATERLRAERERLEAQNRDLQGVLERKERLALRLRDVLSAAETERRQLDEELARILGENPAATGAAHWCVLLNAKTPRA